jgi:hypothetical protein
MLVTGGDDGFGVRGQTKNSQAREKDEKSYGDSSL